jgi:acetyltransferase-like isoleucine patch superfamily enzyme
MSKLKELEALRDRCRWTAATWTNDLIEVGDFTYGRPIVHQWDKVTRLKIGKFCSIAGNVHILLGGEHHTEWVTTYPFDVLLGNSVAKSKGDVVIGNDVWIGENVTILSGVTIGDGAVIGAGSVVARDVAPYAVMAGNPIELKGVRMNAMEASDVGELHWWDWPMEKLSAAVPLLIASDVGALTAFDRGWMDV